MSEHSTTEGLAAAIDIGTNTVLCLVGRRAADGSLSVIEDRSQMPRLGEGIAHSGRIDETAAARTLDVLEEVARRLDDLGVPQERRAVSTAVLRRASNAAEFVAAARARTGLAIEILPGEEEARLGHAAVADANVHETIVVDVGGGSTELAWNGGRSRASVPVGAVVLNDLYGAGIEAAWVAAREACLALPEGVASAAPADQAPAVVAIGGTAVNLASLVLGLERFDAERTEGTRVETPEVLQRARALAALSPSQRGQLPIESGREEVLPCGLACLAAALERIGAKGAAVSLRGLRYGVLAALVAGE